MKYIQDSVDELELSKQVVFTGFVSNTEMRYLYKQSFALTMPSYFGPTNLPPLEAFQLGVPVIYGDINGAREQLRDAAIFLDLSNYQSLCDAVISLGGYPSPASALRNTVDAPPLPCWIAVENAACCTVIER